MSLLEFLGDTGFILALCFSAFGSLLGTRAAGMGALGAWKKNLMANKSAPFILVAFAGAPLSQTIYGMILMNAIKGSPETISVLTRFSAGLLGGIAIGLSAWFQGRAGALACDVFAESEKGFANYMTVIGIIETVALFVMVFLMTILR